MNSQPDEIEEIRRLFHEHVPQVASGSVEIKGIARERGYLTIVAVHSIDTSVEAVGACVGERGVHVKTIVRHLAEETVRVVLWSESLELFWVIFLLQLKLRELPLMKRRGTRLFLPVQTTRHCLSVVTRGG